MTLRRALLTGLLSAFAVVGVARAAGAQVTSTGSIPALDGQEGQTGLPNRLAGQVGITEHLGGQVPLDLTFRDEAGRPVRSGDLFGRGRPVLLAFVYHSCPMLCSLVLDGVVDGAKGANLPVGTDYDILAVSMDPRDTPAQADSAKARYVRRLGQPEAAAGMHFWTVTPETEASVKRLADAVGFRYAWDVRTQEYAHSAAAFVLTPDGTVARYLYGIDYPPRDVRFALVEAGEGRTGSTLDRFLLTCYEYDEHAQGYSLEVLSLLKWLGGGMLLIGLSVLVPMWRRELRRQRRDLAGGPAASGEPDAPAV